MDNKPGIIVIDSSKKKNEELMRKWKGIHKTSSDVASLASTGFVASLLSPFDFDGPEVEIVTAVIAAVAFAIKKVAEFKLDKFSDESIKVIDGEDKDTLLTVVNNMGTVVGKRKR